MFKRLKRKISKYLTGRIENAPKIFFDSKILNMLRCFLCALILRYKFRRKFVDQQESFLKLHISCGDRAIAGYLNIDSKPTSATDYICSALWLPLPSGSVEIIKACYKLDHLTEKKILKILKEWQRVLIPGGELIIECSNFDQTECIQDYGFKSLKRVLENAEFAVEKKGISVDKSGSGEQRFEVIARKSLKHLFDQNYYDKQWWLMRKAARPEAQLISWWEKHIFNSIFHELEDQLFENKKVIDLGCGSGEKDVIMAREGHSVTGIDLSENALKIAQQHKEKEKLDNIQFVNGSLMQMPFRDNAFDNAVMIEVLEHLDCTDVDKIFREIKRILKPEGKLLITVPRKYSYSDFGHIQIFTKGLLAKLLDQQEFFIEFIEWEKRRDAYRKHDMLKVLCTNKSPVIKNGKRICALGAYDIRYDQLGFHWDGQARAFQELGYDTLLLSIRDSDYNNLKQQILEFKPDILWLGLKDCLPFIKWMEADIKSLGCKVIYWFCDLRGIEGIKSQVPLKYPLVDLKEFKDILDYIFLSNAGQIEDYKKVTGIENIFYMGRSCSENFHYRIKLDEKFDIAFAGKMDKNIFHSKRTELIKKISKKYNFLIRDNVINNISEFYSSAKIAFGADVIDESSEFQPYLYTSNRLFIALACGTCYICQWFPGLEELAENHKHLVWFKNEEELFEQIDYYLQHDEERETIRRNAQELAYSKYTHLHRIKNIFNIINHNGNF